MCVQRPEPSPQRPDLMSRLDFLKLFVPLLLHTLDFVFSIISVKAMHSLAGPILLITESNGQEVAENVTTILQKYSIAILVISATIFLWTAFRVIAKLVVFFYDKEALSHARENGSSEVTV